MKIHAGHLGTTWKRIVWVSIVLLGFVFNNTLKTVVAAWPAANPTTMLSRATMLSQASDLDSSDSELVPRSIRETPPTWYDPETGKIRSLSEFQTVFELEEGNRSEARSSAAINFSNTLSSLWDRILAFFDWIGSGLPDLGWLSDLHWFWWVLLAVILILICVLVAYFLKLDALQRLVGGRRGVAKKKRKAATIEDLPFELESEAMTTENLLQAARAAQQQGNLRLAMIYLFSHLLLRMDEKELITLRKGKTNRVYAKEVARSDRQSLPLYNSVMMTFEKCFFGHHALHNDEVLNLVNETEHWA